ncbi:MAG: thioredoxin family protein [Burkholderiales bacterium]
MKEIILISCAAIIAASLLLQWFLASSQKTMKNRPAHEKDGIYLFTSPTCPICAQLKKTFSSEKTDGKIALIDITENTEMARHFNIRSVPTTIVVQNGIVAETFIGLAASSKLSKWLES